LGPDRSGLGVARPMAASVRDRCSNRRRARPSHQGVDSLFQFALSRSGSGATAADEWITRGFASTALGPQLSSSFSFPLADHTSSKVAAPCDTDLLHQAVRDRPHSSATAKPPPQLASPAQPPLSAPTRSDNKAKPPRLSAHQTTGAGLESISSSLPLCLASMLPSPVYRSNALTHQSPAMPKPMPRV
jgi:hypothetical protein